MKRQIRSPFLLAAVAALALHGCDQNLIAPDDLGPDPGLNAFWGRLDKNCGELSVGDQTLSYLLDENNNDSYFLDISSKLYYDRVTEAQYRDDINSNYPTDTNQKALDCIFAQLGGG